MFHSVIGPELAGWLMSDGYRVYRDFALRLRCWAHLIRKARALAETYTPYVQGYGVQMLEIFDTLIEAVHQARASPPSLPLPQRLAGELGRLKELCEKMARSQNEKARKLGRELLNDWEAIFRVLEHPQLPLTNNIAERILRHWVILRRITYGTRTLQGSLSLAITASVIETCRLRHSSPLRYLQQVIAARRAGLDAPPLPPIPSNEAVI
jgi:transposase